VKEVNFSELLPGLDALHDRFHRLGRGKGERSGGAVRHQMVITASGITDSRNGGTSVVSCELSTSPADSSVLRVEKNR